jgi:butyrate kinase
LLMARYGEDEANLGALIAYELTNTCRHDIAAYVVNPSSVDEMEDVYKISGIPDIERQSKFHALNHKSVAKNYARSLGKKYEDVNLIVAHMGLGTTIGAHCKGKVIDVNNGLDGDGPFSVERTGSLPLRKLADLCFSGTYTKKEVLEMISHEGGLYSYFHTRNAKEIENMVIEGDARVALIYTAMAYQVSKEIGAMAAVLKGNVDAILLTGGLSYSEMLCNYIKEKVSYIADVIVYPGEDELKELADAVIRALDGEESLFIYV